MAQLAEPTCAGLGCRVGGHAERAEHVAFLLDRIVPLPERAVSTFSSLSIVCVA